MTSPVTNGFERSRSDLDGVAVVVGAAVMCPAPSSRATLTARNRGTDRGVQEACPPSMIALADRSRHAFRRLQLRLVRARPTELALWSTPLVVGYLIKHQAQFPQFDPQKVVAGIAAI